MRNLAKRILTLLVVLAVIITGVPFTVMAETGRSADDEGITIDLSKTDESIDEVLSNIQGLNALANGEKANAHQNNSSEEHKPDDDVVEEVITDRETNSFEDEFFDTVIEETVKQESGIKIESTTENESSGDALKYSLNNGKVTITRYIGNETEVVIPKTIEGYLVTSIEVYAFSGRSSLTSITIPDSVTSIGYGAFCDCSSLTSVVIPNGVKVIENGLFEGCSALTSVIIPDSVTSIGDYAFSNCSSLTSITIPDGVASIGDGAFYFCSSLTSIIIPEGVTSVGSFVFSGCSLLTSITVSENNTNYTSEAGVLFNKDKTLLICCPGGKSGEYTIPDSVKSIGDYAFSECSSLTNIVIPEGVTNIGWEAFGRSSLLKHITIPNSITSIGGYAFIGCSSLTSIIISDNVTSIGNYAFYYCSSLTSITIPDGVTSIENYVFYGCSSLTSITIPDSVTSIGDYAFEGCSSLTSITIPDGVTSIGNAAFNGCSSLISVTIPESVTRIGDYAFWCYSLNHVYYTGNEEEWKNEIIGRYNEYLTNADIHYNVMVGSEFKTIIHDATCTINKNETKCCNYCDFIVSFVEEKETAKGHNYADCICKNCGLSENYPLSYSFDINKIEISDCDTTVTTVIIPTTIEGYPVTSIGDFAFSECSSLTNITIPDSVTSIGYSAFRNCSSLTSITIPNSVTKIGSSAFEYCDNLNHIYYTGTENEWENNLIYESNEELFNNVIIHYDVVYGSGLKKTNYDATCTINKINVICCNYCDHIFELIEETETETAKGHNYIDGVCQNCGLAENFPLSYRFNNDGITIIGCDTTATTVTIPNTIEGYPVTSIGDNAFENCSLLTNIIIPESVTSIGNNAFYGCSALISLNIHESVTSIGSNAFHNCASLTHITILCDLWICENMFSGCTSLKSITIPISVEIIHETEISRFKHICYLGTENDWLKIKILKLYGGKLDEFLSMQKWLDEIADDDVIIHYDVVPGGEFEAKENDATCTINRENNNCCKYCNNFVFRVEEKDTAKGHNYIDGVCSNCGLPEDFPLSYALNDGTITITDCDSSAIIVSVPATIEGYPVTSIGEYAFAGCSSLTSIVIPNGVTSIGSEAFNECSALTSVTIPDSVTSIGNRVFEYCSSLTSITVSENNKNYTSEAGVLFNKDKTEIICCPDGKNGDYMIPNSVTSIGSEAFSGCSALTSVTIPDGVTSIGKLAFCDCSSLKSVVIPNGMKVIESGLFEGCSALTSVTIPDSVTYIFYNVFVGCSSLISITVSENNAYFTSEAGVLFNKGKTEIICCPGGKNGEYTIPNSVTSIRDWAFFNCSSLTSITIPDGVTSIGYVAFYCCSSLTSITIPDSVTSIGDDAFFYCSSLTSITIPDGVTSIGDYAFRNCSSLTSITIPDSVTSIGDGAFFYCSSLTSITIPDSVTSIGDDAFRNCSSLTSITIPDSVTFIGRAAFRKCSSLKNVNYTGSEESWNKISVYDGNDDLINADIHFNYILGALPEEITPSTDSDVVIDSGKSLVTGLTPQMTPADVATKFEGAENIQIVDKDGNVLAADALVGTGSKIQLVENGEVIDEVTVVIKGEIDGNGIIDSDDAIYMLRNTLFLDLFPVVVDDDVDGNGVYDSDDAIHLLRYTLFPDLFPLV